MNRTWNLNPHTGDTVRDYTDPAGPVPHVAGAVTRSEGRIWWNLAVTDGRDKWNQPNRTVIASGSVADTPYALAVVKARVTRLGRAAARLERDTATARAITELQAALELAGSVAVATAPTKHLRRCAWERDMAAARVERLLATA